MAVGATGDSTADASFVVVTRHLPRAPFGAQIAGYLGFVRIFRVTRLLAGLAFVAAALTAVVGASATAAAPS